MSTRTLLLHPTRTCSRLFSNGIISANTIPLIPTLRLFKFLNYPCHYHQRHIPPTLPFTFASPSSNNIPSNARRCFASKNLTADDTAETMTGPTRTMLGRKGKEEELHVTEQAARQLVHLARQDGQPDQALRITVESGGCHGFQYHLDLTTKMERDDVCFEKDGAKVLVDHLSLSFIEGSKLDFVQELIGSAFRVTQNPKATTGCGCGTSFGV